MLPNQTKRDIKPLPLSACSAISFPRWGHWIKHQGNKRRSHNSYGSLVQKKDSYRLMATRNPAYNSPVEVGSLSHYLQGFIHFRSFQMVVWDFVHVGWAKRQKALKIGVARFPIFSNAWVRPKRIYKKVPLEVWFLIFKCCVTCCDNQYDFFDMITVDGKSPIIALQGQYPLHGQSPPYFTCNKGDWDRVTNHLRKCLNTNFAKHLRKLPPQKKESQVWSQLIK